MRGVLNQSVLIMEVLLYTYTVQMEQDSPLVLWHSFSELQLLLRLDFHGTAVVRKEDLIRNMWDNGDLQPKVRVSRTFQFI